MLRIMQDECNLLRINWERSVAFIDSYPSFIFASYPQHIQE